tara:strand:- start:276 stop:467 length:192 start_codon:yes stop_codon:yes gene_type:complete
MPAYDPSAYDKWAETMVKDSAKNVAGMKGPQMAENIAVMRDPQYNIMDPSPAQSGRILKNGRT